MIVVGSNLAIVANELNTQIESIASYKITEANSVSVYDVDNINHFLNIANDFYRLHNAWVTVPGEYLSYLSDELLKIKIGGAELLMPHPLSKFAVKDEPDIFTFINKHYNIEVTRIFDLVYTYASINKMSFLDFLNAYAIKW